MAKSSSSSSKGDVTRNFVLSIIGISFILIVFLVIGFFAWWGSPTATIDDRRDTLVAPDRVNPVPAPGASETPGPSVNPGPGGSKN